MFGINPFDKKRKENSVPQTFLDNAYFYIGSSLLFVLHSGQIKSLLLRDHNGGGGSILADIL
jgi:hypothetical protein